MEQASTRTGNHTPYETEASMSTLLRSAVDNVREPFREEVALARAEQRAEVSKATVVPTTPTIVWLDYENRRRANGARPFVISRADNPLGAALLSPPQQTSATVLQHQKYDFCRQITDNSAISAFRRAPASNLLKSSAQQPI
jgi:hypothetical protein